MTERLRLSVVVPAFENGDLLDITLGGLAAQTMPVDDFEVIVSDDGSTPTLAPVVDKHTDRLHLTYVGADENRGRSASRNAGAARARADLLVFLDADTVPHPDLLSRHWGFHAARPGRPGVLLGRRDDVDWAGADAFRRGVALTDRMLDAYRADPRDVHCCLPQQLRDFRRAPWVLGFSHNTSVDRATFEAVGGFDEAMVKWGLEDMELFYRIFHHHGGPPDLFELSDDAVAYHLPHYRPTRELMGTLDNLRYVARKHPRYDLESMHSPATLGQVLARVRLYGDSVAACRREGLGRPDRLPGALRESLAGASALAIGFGVAGLALGPGSRTFDHDAPLTDTNWHLLGLMMHHFKTGQFAHLVNIDLWRFFQPEDLSSFVTKALLKADQLHLVGSHDAPDSAGMLPVPFLSDLGTAVRMLAAHFTVETTTHDHSTVLTIR